MRSFLVLLCWVLSPVFGSATALAVGKNPSITSVTTTDSSISLSWSNPSSNDYYLVAYRQGSSAPAQYCSSQSGTTVVSVSGTSLTINNLLENTQYRIRVCGVDILRWSHSKSKGTLTQATTDTATILPAPNPTNFTASPAGESSIDLAWTNAGGSTSGFVLAQSTSSTPANCSGGIDLGLVNSHQVTNLSASTTHYFRLCAYNADDLDSSGVLAEATTDAPAPQPVTPLFNWLSGGCDSAYCVPYACAVANNGDILLVGEERFSGIATIRRFNETGVEINNSNYPKRMDIGYGARFQNAVFDSQNNSYVAGMHFGQDGSGGYLYKFDAVGNLVWVYQPNDMGIQNSFYGVELGSSETYIYVSGKTGTQLAAPGGDSVVVKVSVATGQEVARSPLGDCSGNIDDFRALAIHRTGNPATDIIYAAGSSRNCVSSTSGDDWVIRKFDANLNEIASGLWPIIVDQGGADHFGDAVVDPSGNLIVVGDTDPDPQDPNNKTAWSIRRYDANGNILNSLDIDDALTGDEWLWEVELDSVSETIYVAGTTGNQKKMRAFELATFAEVEEYNVGEPSFTGEEEMYHGLCLDPRNNDVVTSGYYGDPNRAWFFQKWPAR